MGELVGDLGERILCRRHIVQRGVRVSRADVQRVVHHHQRKAGAGDQVVDQRGDIAAEREIAGVQGGKDARGPSWAGDRRTRLSRRAGLFGRRRAICSRGRMLSRSGRCRRR